MSDKNQKYRLGLDLGTNSIGWCIYSLDGSNKPDSLIDMGVRIFSDGRDPKTKEPLAVERRTARGLRRILHRRKLRRKQMFRLLQEQGLMPNDASEAAALKSLNPYELRVKALDAKLEPYELGRVLFNLSVRRGFKSNRKEAVQEKEKDSQNDAKSQNEKCERLAKAIKDSGCRTLGEFLWKHKNTETPQMENDARDIGMRFVPGRSNYYPTRQMYVEEFDAIRKAQGPYYSGVNWDALHEKLFYQRPLRVQERGKCRYMPDKERTFKAMSCSQKIRILQEVYNMDYIDEYGKTIPLEEAQTDSLISLLDKREKLSFKAMKKELGLDESCTFNLERGGREYLQGNVTAVKLRNKNRFGELWDSLSLAEQDAIVEKLITADEDAEIISMLAQYNLTDEQKKNIAATVLPSGTSMLCKEVTEQLVEKMEQNKIPLTVAVQMIGYTYADQSVHEESELPYYGAILTGSTMGAHPEADQSELELKYGKISNPTVHVALNQTRTVVNTLIRAYGKPQQIVVELSRDLKASREAKARIQKTITANQKRNERDNKNITEITKIPYPNREDRLKYRLWEELGSDSLSRKCLYCGKTISGSEIFTKDIEIEHILPFGRTLFDGETNKTVAHTNCNRDKGNLSPFEAFGSSPSGYNWHEICARANSLKNPAKRALFAENAMEKFEKDSSFIQRQLTDNAYLSRSALRYLRCICKDVWSVNGSMTKLLRGKWNIDSILKRKIDDPEIAHFELKNDQIGQYKKNRYDHRHHALDASVIALIDRAMVQEISQLNKIRLKNRIEAPQMPVLRSELIEKVKHITVSFKPDHGRQGKLSKETLLGKIKKIEKVNIDSIQTDDDIASIKDDVVRTRFEIKRRELGDITKAKAALKTEFPKLDVFKTYYVSRTPIVSLTEKNIDSIVDEKIKEKLKTFIKEHADLSFAEQLQKFSETEWSGKPSAAGKPGKKYRIEKVRCINWGQTPIRIASSAVPRYLCPEDYLAAVVWQMPAKKKDAEPEYKATFLRRDEFNDDNKPKKLEKPHDAAKYICMLYKDDYLEFTENGATHLCRIAGLPASQENKIDIRPIYAASNCKDWIIATNDNMLEPCWRAKEQEKRISVNVLFGKHKAHSVTVNPIGRVFRK